MSKICKGCGKEIIGKRKNAIFCCSKCCSAYYSGRYLENNGMAKNRSTAVAGVISEISVSLDLLEKGYFVFRPLAPNGPCDLAILKEKQLLLIEVTSGARTATGKLMYPPHNKYKHIFDIIAVVERNGTISYFPDLP